MTQRLPILLVSILLLLVAVPGLTEEPPAPDAAAIVDKITEALNDDYIFADVAQKMRAHLHQRLADGAYEGLDVRSLTGRLTEDLQEISHDLHLWVNPLPPSDLNEEHEVDEEAMMDRYLVAERRSNYGFKKMEILAGNVGYLDLRGFSPAEYGGKTAVAAMGFLSGSDALIIDLRKNGGGSPSMIQLISSYFFAEPQHLNSFEIRREDTVQQFWTQAHVEGKKMVDVPIWVLTSGRTFSAAEEFTYNLKNMERATIVGETTGGGAHPVDTYSFPEVGVRMSLPFGRAVNPISKTNWEGTGIAPHVEVEAAKALEAAYGLALEKLAEGSDDPDQKARLTWALEGIRAAENPMGVSLETLKEYIGSYAPRRIFLEDGALRYQRAEGPIATLSPMREDLFRLDIYDHFRLRFERDEKGRVILLVGVRDDGDESPSPRTEDSP